MKRPKNPVMGGLFMLLFALFLAMMSGMAKFAQSTASTFQVVFFQQLIGLIFIIPLVRTLKTERLGLHLVRDLAGVGAYLTLFTCVSYISLVDAVLLNNTGPLFVPFIVAIWFRKKIPLKTWWGILIGFAGVVLILQPGIGVFHPVMILGLISGACMAVTFITQRVLNTTEGIFTVLFYYFFTSSLVTLPLAIWRWNPLTSEIWGALIGVGILNLFAQTCMIFAFSYYTTSILAPLIYLAVIFSGMIDWIVWQEVPNWISLIGIFLVILGGILSLTLSQLNRRSGP